MTGANRKKTYSYVMGSLRQLSRRRGLVRDLKAVAFSLILTGFVALSGGSFILLISAFCLFTALSHFYLKRKLGPISPFTEARRLESKYSRFEESLSTICSYSRGKRLYSHELYERVLDDASLSLEAVSKSSEVPLRPALFVIFASTVFCSICVFFSKAAHLAPLIGEAEKMHKSIGLEKPSRTFSSHGLQTQGTPKKAYKAPREIMKKSKEGFTAVPAPTVSQSLDPLDRPKSTQTAVKFESVSSDYANDIKRFEAALESFEKEIQP